ncbi:hypothetical protein C8R43DRAFT_662980 [Mycena crocata]|nr:hypothetical protein C8R43DRAFT_662980 [Mycena crocata]
MMVSTDLGLTSSSGEVSLSVKTPYFIFGLVVQTFFFGGYTVLMLLSTRMLLKRGLRRRANMVMSIVTISMYLLATAYWAYSVADVVSRVQLFIQYSQLPASAHSKESTPITKWYALFNALVLVNYIFSDGIVVWRAWVICSHTHRTLLRIPIVFLIFTAVSIIATIPVRIASMINPEFGAGLVLTSIINVLQLANLALSLISNLFATGIVGITAWRHRQKIRAAFRERSKSDQILTLLLESGILYCISGLTTLVASLIRLPYGTLGDIYTPVNVQIAGAYAPIILLMVSNQSSFNETNFLGTIPVVSGRVKFTPGSQNRHTAISTMHFAQSAGDQSVESGTQPMARVEGVEKEKNLV